MATITLISATGRLKNKIQIVYRFTSTFNPEFPSNAGLAYSANNSFAGSTIVPFGGDYEDFGFGFIQNRTFANIPNGTWYVWAWVDTTQGGATQTRYNSGSMRVIVSSSGYELSDEGSTIANPLVIAGGTEGKDKALFSDSSGLATWKPVGEMFAYGHYIGELYGGGIVVSVWKEADEEKVLIASLENLKSTNGRYDPAGSLYSGWIYPEALWNRLVGTQASSSYNGMQNTNAITAFSLTGSAAQVCADYRGGGYEDWYLPSSFELSAIYSQSSIISKVLGYDTLPTGDGYWSSTEFFSDSVLALLEPGSNCRIESYRKINELKIRAVRKESSSAGDGVVLSLDATNSKSFSDTSYYLSGTGSRWSCLVNRGMSSSYSFALSTAGSSSGGTLTQILTLFTTTGTTTDIFSGTVGNWTLSFISSSTPTTPKLYNRTGESSFVSSYFNAAYSDCVIKFDAGDFSYVQGTGVKMNIYVSVQTPGYVSPYTLVRQISITTAINSISTYTIPLYQYVGKSISIKITSPDSYWNSTSSFAGPSIDNIYVQGTNGGFQNTGPRYFPDQGGYLKFASSGGVNGSFVNFKAPIGSATTVTVEVWARMASSYSGTMLFCWDQYNVYMPSGHLGYNTNSSDVYGINSTKVSSLGIVGNWAHYIFEMRSDVSYTNNKIYINGELQALSQVLAGSGESALRRNFNFGIGRIGGFGASNNYLFNGDISVFRVYNRALTKDEIMKNFESGRKRYEIRPSVLRDGIYSYIDFNNPASYSGDGTVSGSVNDLAGEGRPASLVITPTTAVPAVQRTSRRLTLGVGRLIFPGTTALNPYITWPSTAAIQNATNISISFWIYFDEARTAEIIVKWASSSNGVGPWEVFQSAAVGGSAITFRLISGSTIYQRTGLKVIPNAKWTHVCATYNDSSKKIKTYINSEIDIDYTWPSQMSMDTATAGDIFVGQYPPTATTARYPLKGSISNMQIYTRTLEKEEIKNNYNADKFEFDDATDAAMFFSHELTGNPTFSISHNLTLDIPGKSNDRILASDTNGNAIWRDKSSLFDRPTNYRYIGELYGGGIIVGMWKYPSNTYNYLIMATEDINNSVTGQSWSNIDIGYQALAYSEYNGASNSTAIMAQSGHISSAAKLCDDYTGGGFTDWYLPSSQEMLMAYNAGEAIGYVTGQDTFGELRSPNQNVRLSGTYWTSTECDLTLDGSMPDNDLPHLYAFALSVPRSSNSGFLSGAQPLAPAYKGSTYSVRPFRQVRINERRPIWNPEWEWDYVPVEEGWNGWYPWSEINWSRTSITIDVLPITYEVRANVDGNTNTWMNQGYVSMTFSNSINTTETILRSGVCWSKTSTSPTISDSFTYSIVGDITKVYAYIPGPLVGSAYNENENRFIYFRAFITTPTGTYYSLNSGRARSTFNYATYPYPHTGIESLGTTYSIGSSVLYYPDAVFTFNISAGFYNRS